jgi:hypothetical protein
LRAALFEVLGDLEEGILLAELGEDAVAGDLDDAGAGVEVLVDAVSEAHEAEVGVLVLALADDVLSMESPRSLMPSSISRTAWLAPPWRRPQRAETPADMEVKRLAWELPTMRTVEVEQFCS